MANIRNSIGLKDQMTPVLRKILKAMDSTLKAMDRMDRQASGGKASKAYKQAEKDIKSANNALTKMINNTDRASKSADTLAGKYKMVNEAFKGAPISIGNMFQAFASGIYTLQHVKDYVTDIMKTIDNAQSQAARLDLFDNTSATGAQLYGQVFKTAMDTRSGLTETADLAQKLIISGVFDGPGTTSAAIGMAGIINKALIAGGGTQEQNNRALLQLTQGLASGVLQGDELRSIREQAPQFAQYLAEGLATVDEKFKGIGIGDLKELGAQGELTSDKIVKAMFNMQDRINEDFEQMPRTFGQATTSLGNIWQYFLFLLSSTEGPLSKITDMLWQLVDYLQSDAGSHLLESLAIGLNVVAWAIGGVMKIGGSFINFLSEHKALVLFLIGVIAAYNVVMFAMNGIMAISALLESRNAAAKLMAGGASLFKAASDTTATGAQLGLNAAMLAFPGTWIIMILLALIAVFLIFTEQIVGSIWWLGALFKNIGLWIANVALGVWNTIKNVGLWFANLGLGIWEVMKVCWQNVGTAFSNAWKGMKAGWYGFVNTILEGVKTIIGWLNKIPGVSIGTDSIENKILNNAAKIAELNDSKGEYGSIGDAWNKGWNTHNIDWGKGWSDGYNTFDTFQSGWGSSAYSAGAKIGAGLNDSISNLFGLGGFGLGDPGSGAFSDLPVSVKGGDLDSVGSVKSDVSISDEDVQLLRDMAAREYLLQLQSVTPVAHVTFGDVRETADVNKILEVIEEMVEEQLATSLVS